MQTFLSFLFTLLAGLFFLGGFLIVRFSKQKQKLSVVATSMAFIVMIGILIFDLIPEITKTVNGFEYNVGVRLSMVLIPIFLGILILKILDNCIPHHHHEHHEHEKNKKEHNLHSSHIGIVTSTSVIIHNILEGISIFVLSLENLLAGFLMALGVGLHNVPLGIEIASSLKEYSNKKVKNIFLWLVVLSLSIGAFFLLLTGGNISEFIMLFVLCLSFGMILYIALIELLKEVYTYRKQKETIIGLVIGVVLVLCMCLLGGD